MGTSSSSKGPGKGVSLIPPWVPVVAPLPTMPINPELNLPLDQEGNPLPGWPEEKLPNVEPFNPARDPLISPPKRFAGARLNLGKFAYGGEERYLKASLGHYTHKGLGGSKIAAKRMAGTARNAGRLFNVLHSITSPQIAPTDIKIDFGSLRGRPAREICDRIVELVRPMDGTLDAEASRRSIYNALRDLMTENPEVDLTSLGQEQIEFVIERYIAFDISARVELDIGENVLKKAELSSGMQRLEEIRSFIGQVVAASFRALRGKGLQITQAIADSFAARAIEKTFVVFEGWY